MKKITGTLIEVDYKDKAAIMTFLDEENGEVREVKFNKQKWGDGEFVDDDEKAEQVEKWCKEYFDTTFDNLESAVGCEKEIYCYDTFNSLWESEQVTKFDKGRVGEIIMTKIKDVTDDGTGIHIYFENEGTTYESKMMYSKYVPARNEWFVDPQRKVKTYDKFEKKFGVSVENAGEIVDKDIMVEVKLAMGKYPYADIKKPNWK